MTTLIFILKILGALGECPDLAEQGEEKVLNETLMGQVMAPENLHAAYLAVKANRGAPGIDGITTEELGDPLRKHWVGIRTKLEEGRYQPSPARAVDIPKDGGGTRRHMRKWFWQRWHNWKGGRNAFIRLGVRACYMRLAHSSRGAWRMGGNAQRDPRERLARPVRVLGAIRYREGGREPDLSHGQPPDAENGMSGGVGGVTGAIPSARPDQGYRAPWTQRNPLHHPVHFPKSC